MNDYEFEEVGGATITVPKPRALKIAVTGSSGLIGSNLVKRLIEAGHDVSCFDLVTGCDLNNESQVEKLFSQISPDVVYHLAANAAEARGQISPVDMIENNIGIFANTLKASINAKVKKFIFTSSVAVYGEANVPYKEDGPTIPKDVYGVNKLACEQILRIMAKVYKFNYVIFRPHNVYGPGQNMSDPYKNVVALFMRKLLEGEPYKLFGYGKMRRAFSYVDDVVKVMMDSLDMRFTNATLNVGSSHDVSIKELSDLIQEVSERHGEIEMLKGRPQEISMFLADHTNQDALTTYPETPLKEGLQKTWEWARLQHLLPIVSKKDEIYVQATH
jgi:UDP-glucose 4-epimerase